MPRQGHFVLEVTLFISSLFAVTAHTRSFLPASASSYPYGSDSKTPFDSSGRNFDVNLDSLGNTQTTWTVLAPTRSSLAPQEVASSSSIQNSPTSWKSFPSSYQSAPISNSFSTGSKSFSSASSSPSASSLASSSSSSPVSNDKYYAPSPLVSSPPPVSKIPPISNSWSSFQTSSPSSKSASNSINFSNSNYVPINDPFSTSRSSFPSSNFSTPNLASSSTRPQPYQFSTPFSSSQTFPSVQPQETTSSQSSFVSQPNLFSTSNTPAEVMGPNNPPAIVSKFFTPSELSKFPSYPPDVGVSTFQTIVQIPEVLLDPISSPFSMEITPPRVVPLDPTKPPSVTYFFSNEASGNYPLNSVEEVSNSVKRLSLNIGQGSILSSGVRAMPSNQGQLGSGVLLGASRGSSF